MEESEYRYFISYSYQSEQKSGFGNYELQTNQPIDSIERVMEITRSYETEKDFMKYTMVINNFIRLED